MSVVDQALRRPPSERQPCVLVVDDDHETRQAILDCLRGSLPWAILIEAANAQDAWSLVRRHGVDLVVSDQCMPGMDGLTLLRRVRFEYPAVTRILLTGRPDLDTDVEAIQDMVADQYLLKPLTPTRLCYAVALQLWVQHEDGRCRLSAQRAAELREQVRSLGLGLRLE